MLNFKIPAIQDKFYPDTSVVLIKNKLNNVIRAKYGRIINNISKITGLNTEIIESFIFIESAGDEKAKTPYAYGLMQVGLATASDALVFEKASGRLSAEEDAIVKKYLGNRYSNLNNLKKNQKSIGKTFTTSADLFNPEFNILLGSIIVKQLVDEFTENGNPRLDKVVVIYNTGRFSKPAKLAIKHKGDTDSLLAKIPRGQGDYIRKLIGKNSLLDIIV
jgi:soluble lytic murein transglycosylase-like protein